ncbi:hypothetical protein OAZ91_00780 [bacterium]|nr:hypothetical protein [bacterium]
MTFEQRLRLHILKNPNDYLTYLRLSCELDDISYLSRARMLKRDLLSGIPTTYLSSLVRSNKGVNVYQKIFESEIYYSPKAALFAFKGNSPDIPDGHTIALWLHADPHHLTGENTLVKGAIGQLSRLKRADANTTVVVLAKDPTVVKEAVISVTSKPLILCWHAVRNKPLGYVEQKGHLTIFHGAEDPIDRLYSALHLIETDYLFITGDDDLVFDRFLATGERLLDKFPALGSVCGLGFDTKFQAPKNEQGHNKPLVTLIRMSENPVSIKDINMRAEEWALFGGLSLNSLIRKVDLEKILPHRPSSEFSTASEYFIDICLMLCGPSIRTNNYSIVRARRPTSGTYTHNPPILETAATSANILREIAERVIAFCRSNQVPVDDNTIEWVVAYGASRRFLENSAFNKGISTLPKSLYRFQKDRLFLQPSIEEKAFLYAISLTLFEEEVLDTL